MKRLSLFLCLLFALQAVVAQTTNAIPFQPKKTIKIKKGEKLLISAPQNITTGYSWKYEIKDNSKVIVAKEEYIVEEHAEGMVGVGGTKYYELEGLKKGKTKIYFQYSRGNSTDVARKHKVKIKVI